MAQAVHAAGESSQGNIPDGTHAVVLGVDAESLAQLEQRLQDASVPHRAIRESDAPYNGELMAIGIQPCQRSAVRKYLSSFPLLREKESK